MRNKKRIKKSKNHGAQQDTGEGKSGEDQEDRDSAEDGSSGEEEVETKRSKTDQEQEVGMECDS